ncbi:hypothetical protein [Alloscardovia omnicolens]|uniref:hypothetical protein n=1 Tax=Alloscardovia omnicolens TaxID=419015 RepID=UPI003A68FC22
MWQAHSRTIDVDPAKPFEDIKRLTAWITQTDISADSTKSPNQREWIGSSSWLGYGPDTLGGTGKVFGYVEPDETRLTNFPPQSNVYVIEEETPERLSIVSKQWARSNGMSGAQLCLAVKVEGHWVIADKPHENVYRVFGWEIIDGTVQSISSHARYRELWKLHIGAVGRDSAEYGEIDISIPEEVKPIVIGTDHRCADVESADGTIEQINYQSLGEAIRKVTA